MLDDSVDGGTSPGNELKWHFIANLRLEQEGLLVMKQFFQLALFLLVIGCYVGSESPAQSKTRQKRKSPFKPNWVTTHGVTCWFSFSGILPLFALVTFKNSECVASDTTDGLIGTCYSSTDCKARGGSGLGNCAAGFGVCCILT